jgi:hypothetical protein
VNRHQIGSKVCAAYKPRGVARGHNQGRKREMTIKDAYDKLVASTPGAQPAPAKDSQHPVPRKRRKKE